MEPKYNPSLHVDCGRSRQIPGHLLKNPGASLSVVDVSTGNNYGYNYQLRRGEEVLLESFIVYDDHDKFHVVFDRLKLSEYVLV